MGGIDMRPCTTKTPRGAMRESADAFAPTPLEGFYSSIAKEKELKDRMRLSFCEIFSFSMWSVA